MDARSDAPRPTPERGSAASDRLRILHVSETYGGGVFLPFRDEGAPLPMLEGMAVGTFVVCPDAIGNRGYCLDGINCYRPDFDEERIVEAAAAAVQGYDALRPLLANAAETVRAYDLPAERAAFLDLLRDVDRVWAGDDR